MSGFLRGLVFSAEVNVLSKNDNFCSLIEDRVFYYLSLVKEG
jgi:hypothetical protein